MTRRVGCGFERTSPLCIVVTGSTGPLRGARCPARGSVARDVGEVPPRLEAWPLRAHPAARGVAHASPGARGDERRRVRPGVRRREACIAAAREHGARAVGFELDAALASEARHNVFAEGDALASRVEIREEDALAADVKSASVVVMYLSDGGNAKVLPGLAPLAPGRASSRSRSRSASACDPREGPG